MQNRGDGGTARFTEVALGAVGDRPRRATGLLQGRKTSWQETASLVGHRFERRIFKI